MMFQIFKSVTLPAAFVAAMSPVQAQVAPDAVLTQPVTLKSLSLKYQLEAGQAAIDACAANHVPATVVIVDSGGNVRMQMVSDDGHSSLLDEARRKAHTAASLRRSTTDLAKALATNPRMLIPPDPDTLIVGGGVPLRAGSDMVGAIGVAGGTPEENDRCAQAGVDQLNEYLHPEAPAANRQRQNAQPANAPK